MMRAVIGAAADFIVRSAHYPVLVVRGDGILRGVVPHPDTRDAAPEGELETIGEKRTTSRPVSTIRGLLRGFAAGQHRWAEPRYAPRCMAVGFGLLVHWRAYEGYR